MSMRLPMGRALTRQPEIHGWGAPDEAEASQACETEVSEQELIELLWLAEGWAQVTDLDCVKREAETFD